MALNDIITLDVGGTRFRTFRQTLMKVPESMIARMFSPESNLAPAIMVDGAYFLDRSPERFKYILDYLRDGELKVKKSLSTEMLLALQAETDYFQLPNILTNMGTENDSIKINVEGVIINVLKTHLDNIIPLKSLFWCLWELNSDGEKVYFMQKTPFEKFKLILENYAIKKCKPSGYLFDPFDESSNFSHSSDMIRVEEQALQQSLQLEDLRGLDNDFVCLNLYFEDRKCSSSLKTVNVSRTVLEYLIPPDSSFWWLWTDNEEGEQVFNSEGRNWNFTAFCSVLREAVYTRAFTEQSVMMYIHNLYNHSSCPPKKKEIYKSLGLVEKVNTFYSKAIAIQCIYFNLLEVFFLKGSSSFCLPIIIFISVIFCFFGE